MGPRDYSKPLYVKTKKGAERNRAYWTSSFWRYVGEYASNGKSFPPIEQNHRPDYGYLQDFFAKDQVKFTENGELKWLDDNLNKKFNVSLANIYANFIANFAHYVPTRVGDNAKKFRKQIFHDCKKVSLTSIDAHVSINLKFQKVTSQCIEVLISTSGPNKPNLISADIKFADIILGVVSSATSGSSTLKVSMQWAGWKQTDGTIKMAHAAIAEVNGDTLNRWKFTHVSTNKPTVFILSNIADDVLKTIDTANISVEISLAINQFDFE